MKQFKKSKSKLLAMLMTLMMVVSMIPVSAFAEPIDADDTPFTAIVDDVEMTGIDESVLLWTGWDGSSSEVTCYTVTVPEGSEEATLTFDEEKQWSYYDSQGNYVGEGDTSWTSATEHTVAIQDSNSDGELDGISVQIPGAFSAEFYILFKYAEAGNQIEAPFTATVDDVEMSDIDESTLSWIGWDGSSSDVTCYTVTVPEGAEEATLTFDEEKQWSYYDSQGNYVGEGDTSWTSATEHTVAIQDSNSDGELDGISVQIPGAFSAEFYILFKYAGEGSDEPEQPVHTHVYDEVVTTKPTCNEPGEKTFTCSGCEEGAEGHSYTEEVAKTGHKYNNGEITTKATCAAEGEKTFACQNTWCKDTDEGHTKTDKVSKAAHTYDEGVVDPEPTCTETGVKTYTCSVCPEGTTGHTKTETVPAAGHQRGDDTECDVCGDVAPVQDESGTYLIGTEKEMLWLAKTVKEGQTDLSVKLIDSIELNEDWPGIGVKGTPFSGTFDGQNHTITLNGSIFGVFAFVKGTNDNSNFNVKKAAVIENVTVKGKSKNTPLVHSGGYIKVTNCINKATVTGGNSCVAGILGSLEYSLQYNSIKYSDVVIENCINEGNINGTDNVGGILGETLAGTKLNNCTNNGEISGASNVGGLVGYMQESRGTCEVKNSYNTGKVSGNNATAGIIGNMYNGAAIINCYNAGEADYAIAGHIYNNTVSITNTYYRGDMCTYSVPNMTYNAGYFTGDRGIAKTSAEMSTEATAAALGEAFQKSCPSPVFTWQDANAHDEDENIVCDVCKQGSGRPTEYGVIFDAAEGSEIVGDTTFRAGNDYSFKVTILEGYYAEEGSFSVYVNGTKVDADEDGVYFVEKPKGPFYVSVKGVKEFEGILPISLPKEGYGYRIIPCDGYETTVESGKDFKFTVEFVKGFKAGEDFVVKVNGEEIKSDADGVYTIENVVVKQTITAEGIDIVQSGNTVTIDVEITKGSEEFLVAEETETVVMDKQLEIPYFDLALYEYAKYYYNPYCYVDKDGNINGQQQPGTRETAYDVVTAMHAFIYMTEVYYLGYDPEDAGTGYSDTVDSDDDGKSDFDEAVSWGQGVGSSFMNLWGLGSNLNYHLNYEYPIGYVGWGSTSDQQALKDGDRLSVHMITGSASGSGFGLFVVNDDNNQYDRTDIRDRYTVNQGDEIKLTHYVADQGDNYTTAFVKMPNKQLYWIEEGEETANINEWNYIENDEVYADFGDIAAADFRIDENGEIVIDTSSIEPGTYYIGAEGGFTQGTGNPGADGFVSRGAESGPAYFKLTVEESKAALLTKAKEAAKKEVAEYKNAEDYREAQQAELASAIEAAKATIDAAKDTDAVATALTAAKTEIDKIKTDAQLTQEEAEAAAKALAEAKEAAKTEIAGYKNADDYREAQQTELASAIEAANSAIEEAADTDAVAAALKEAKAAIDKIKTDEQLTAEEVAKALAEAKEAAKEEIAGYKNADDYREVQQAELASAIEAANAAIEEAADIDAVAAELAAAKAVIDKIKTDAQLDQEEADALAKAKEDAKIFIADYKAEKEAGGYGYSSEQLTKLQEVIAKAETDIDKAESIEAVEEAKDAAIAEMDTIKTLKEEVSDLTAELENAKKENEANKEAFEKKIADLEAALKEADAADKAAMQEEIKSLQEALKAAEEDSAAKQEKLAGQIEQLQKDIADAKALTEKQREELTAEIKSLQDALDAAKADNAADKKALEEQISDLEADIEALQSEKTQLENQIADLNAKLEKAEADNAAVKAELEGKIAELKEALENADAADKAAMQEEIKSLQEALKKAEEDSAAKQEELAGQIEQLQKDIADAKTLTDKQKEELSSEITELKAELDAADAEKKAMQEEIDALKAELEQLKENKQLDAPTGVKAFNNAVTGKNKVSWKVVKGAEEYAVYRSTSKNGAYKKMFTTTGTTYTNTSAKAGTLYYYKVKALTGDKSVDDSTFSAVVKRTCDLKAPAVTTKSKAKKQVKLTWKKVSGAKKYTVYRATSKNGKYTKIATTKKLSYTNKKLKSGKTYYYKVKAIAKNSAANSAFSTVDKCKSR